MNIKNLKLFFIGLLLGEAILAQDTSVSKGSEIYFSLRRTTVDSATLKNSIATTNGLFVNRFLQGIQNYRLPLTNEFSGSLFAFGWSKEHSPFYKGIFELEGGVLKSGEQQALTLNTATSFFLGTIIFTDSQRIEIFNKSQLATGRLGYTGTIHFLSNQPNEYLKKIGLLVGGEVYFNQAVSSGDIALNNGYSIVSSTRSQPPTYTSLTGVSLLQQELKHTEGFFNLVLGLSYSLEFLKKHKLGLAYKVYDSLAELNGGFSQKSTVYLQLPTLIFPTTRETKGDQKTEFSGNSIHLNYRYSVTESFGIRLGFSEYTGTHKIKESKVKEPADAFAIFAALLGGGDVLIPYIAGNKPGFGPFPSASDKRTQISLEFIYMF